MQVILNEDYPSLGFVGDVVNVKPGFARNYLFPKKIAIHADTESIKLFEHRKRQLQIKKAERQKDAEKLKGKFDGVSVTLEHAATEDNKLFGSVTVTEIHEELKKAGYDIDRKLIKLDAPIKATGEYTVVVKLHQEVNAAIKVIVLKKVEKKTDDKENKKATRKAAPKKEAVEIEEPKSEEKSESKENTEETATE